MPSKTSVRLTDSLRASIRSALIGDKFEDRLIKLYAEYAKVAELAYTTYFSAETRKLMDSLPKGFLKPRNGIRIKFGESGEYVDLDFNGYKHIPGDSHMIRHVTGPYSDPVNPIFKEIKTPRPRLFPYEAHSNALLFPRRGEVSRAYSEVSVQEAAIEKDFETLVQEIDAVLNTTSSSGKLIAIWPEIEPVVCALTFTRAPGLPVPVLTDLNKRLGLKPVKKAA